jgi:hypothetical protein
MSWSTPSNSEVERVAKAMHDADFRQVLAERRWEDNTEQDWWRDMARAAIASMDPVRQVIVELRDSLRKTSVTLKAERDSLFECATLGPDHNPSTLDPGTKPFVDALDEILLEADTALASADAVMGENHE